MSRTLSLLLIFLISFGVKAQTIWTLEECINHALSHNIQLKRMDLQVESAQLDYRQAQAGHTPSISAYYGHNFNKGTTFNQYTLRFDNIESQSGNLGLSSEITLFNGLRAWNAQSMMRHILNSNLESVNVLRNSITISVVVAYLQILYDTENLKLANEQLTVLEQQLDRVSTQLELGVVSPSDHLNLKSQVLTQKSSVTMAEGQLKRSNTELVVLLELDDIEGFAIDLSVIEPDSEYIPLAFSNIYEEIVLQRPEILKAEHDKLAAERSLKMAYGLLSPRVTLGYHIGSGYDQSAWYISPDSVYIEYPNYTYRNQLEDYIQQRVSLNISIPIFQKLSNYTQISKAKIRVVDANYAYQEAQHNVFRDVQRAYTDATTSWANYLALEETARSQQEIYNETLSRFELGMVSAVDVSVAQANLVEAQGSLLNAKYTFMLRSRILDFYRGMPITI